MKETASRLKFSIDTERKNHVAVMVNFEGPGGVVLVNHELITVGADREIKLKEESGKRLDITTTALVVGTYTERVPDVRFVHQDDFLPISERENNKSGCTT